MPPFRIKFLSWAAVAAVLVILVVSITFNILLGLNKARLVDAVNARIEDRFDAGYLAYVFPNIVIIKNAVLAPNDDAAGGGRGGVVRFPTVTAEFSILEFVLRQNVAVQKIKMYSPYFHHGYFSDFLKRNGRQLMEFLLQLPRIDFRFSVKEALWDFTAGAERPDDVRLNFVFRIKKDAVWIRGTARKDQYAYTARRPGHGRARQRRSVGTPLEFDFHGVWAGEGLFIDHLAFNRKNIYLKVWGSLIRGKLQLNGFSFLNTYPREEYQITKPVKQSERILEYLRKAHKPPAGVNLQDKDVYLMDMDALAQIDLPRVELRRLNFNFNDVPVGIKGVLFFKELFEADLDIELDPARSKNFPVKNLNPVRWHLAGASDGKAFTSDSEMYVSFDKTKNPNFPVEKIDGRFKGLRFLLDEHARPSARLNRAEAAITLQPEGRGLKSADERPSGRIPPHRREEEGAAPLAGWGSTVAADIHKLYLEDAAVSFNTLSRTLRLWEVNAPFYGGRLAGKIWLTTGLAIPKIDGAIVLNGVDVHQLDELFFDFARAEGRLSGRVHLTSVPRLNLDGQFDMDSGRLKNFSFFQWLADTFNLPSLQQVDFRRVSSGFAADMDTLRFKKILLISENVDIRGDFAVDRNSLVSSYLTLAFSKKLLGESVKFRPILKIFGGDIPMVVFDFQLSGRQDALNFQWLPSEHKSMIQQRIPNFIERIIERDVDEMMAPAEQPPPAAP